MQGKLIVIGGPTASGKTALAIQLALHFKTEIISADSRQCYKELTIGTAKPSQEELNLVKHHFINSHSITEKFNAGKFAEESHELLNKLFKKHNVVIVTGGSGLYLKALLEGVDHFPDIPQNIRTTLKQELQNNGIDPLLQELKSNDPDYFGKIDRSNPQRILRALEIFRFTGKPYSSYLGKQIRKNNFTEKCMVIDLPRNLLYERIDQRVSVMMENGFLEEVQSLINYRDHPALRTVGYTELFNFLDGKSSLEQAVRLICQHTRNYAKRQLTWFRNQGNYSFFTNTDIIELTDWISKD